MAISNIRSQVMQEFRDKLLLESQFSPKLRKLDNEIVKQFRSDMLRGNITRPEIFQPEMQELLADHYEAVADKFEGRIVDQAPSDEGLTAAEKALLAAALLLFINSRSAVQSKFILSTTRKDMGTIARTVNEEFPDQVERAVAGSAILAQRLRAREAAIVSLETQAMAEAVKVAEFDVLAGKGPLSLQRPPKTTFKEWVTVGDERVRPAHVGADGQVRRIDELFRVGGQQLRFPGDTSFGASAGNVINCRCSAVFDTEKVFAIRRDAGVDPTIVASPPDSLVTFLGG